MHRQLIILSISKDSLFVIFSWFVGQRGGWACSRLDRDYGGRALSRAQTYNNFTFVDYIFVKVAKKKINKKLRTKSGHVDYSLSSREGRHVETIIQDQTKTFCVNDSVAPRGCIISSIGVPYFDFRFRRR